MTLHRAPAFGVPNTTLNVTHEYTFQDNINKEPKTIYVKLASVDSETNEISNI